MDCRALASRLLPHQSKLYLSFLDSFSSVKEFYPHAPEMSAVETIARGLKFPDVRRQAVAAILREQNVAFGAGAATVANLGRLERGAVAIVSGQQVGLFSGPAYSFYKALAAVELAAELTRSGVEAVPVFWMATEDHDVDEVRHVSWFQDGELKRFELAPPSDPEQVGRPVDKIVLGHAVVEQVHAAAELLSKQGSEMLARQLKESYGANETYGSAFAKLFARLFGEQGLILLEPLDARLHRVAAPVYRQSIAESDVLNEQLLERGKKLGAAGFEPQVKVTAKSTLLFYVGEGPRQVIASAGGGKFQTGTKKWEKAELLAEIETAPENFSPSALLRAVVQDYLLPTAAYVAGAAEISYFAQSAVVYERILQRMPVILPRPDFTLVDVKAEKLLQKYKLTVEELWAGPQEVRRKMERVSVPRALTEDFEQNHAQVMKLLDALREHIEKLDPTLQGAVSTTRKKVEFQMDKLRRKTGRALEGKESLLTAHENFLENLLYPHKTLQSRELCLLPFLARLGPGGLAELQKLCGSANLGRHCIVQLS